MQFPLPYQDVILLLATIFIMLLVTLETLSPYYGKTSVLISRKRLKNATLFVFMFLLAIVITRIIYL